MVDPETPGWLGTRRQTIGVAIAWFGVLAPLALSQRRSASEIMSDPVTAVTLFRGITPVACLVIAAILLRARLWPRNRGEWLAVLFALVALASAVWSIAPILSLLKAGVLAAVYGLVILLTRTWVSLREAVASVVTVAQGLVIASLAAGVLVPRLVFSAYYELGKPARLRGLFPEIHSVPLGWLALVALLGAVAGLGRWSWQQRGIGRPLLAAAALVALVLTQTRAAWGGAIVAVLSYLALRGHRSALARVAAALTIVAAAGIVVGLVAGSTVGLPTYLTRGEGAENLASLGWRLPMWSEAMNVWMSRPITGHGYYVGHRLGEYADAFAQLETYFHAEMAFIDGAYVETLLDLGIIGLVPLGSLAVSAALESIRYIRSNSPDRLAVVAAIILWSLIIDSVLSYSWQTPSYQGALLLALALAFHARPPVRTNEMLHHGDVRSAKRFFASK